LSTISAKKEMSTDERRPWPLAQDSPDTFRAEIDVVNAGATVRVSPQFVGGGAEN
jgi:hypothetical protein